MRVVFLDFDGVLNSSASFLLETRKREAAPTREAMLAMGPVNETLDHVCCSNFQLILDKVPDAKIVISSTWRELFELDWLRAKLASYGIDSSRVIDRTPSSFRDRGYEIKAWMEDHPEVTKFVILDDNYIGGGYTDEDIVMTRWPVGLTLNGSLQAIQILGESTDNMSLESLRGLT